jgi:hypothetical protein
MENPFQTIETRLATIEGLLTNLKPNEQIIIESTNDKPLSQPEAIDFLGKSRQTLIAWRKKGIIKAYRLGGRVYYKKSELVNSLK